MANNGRARTILQSMQEIGAIVGGRIREKAAESPFVTSIAQGAAARVRAVVPPRPATPADVVAVADRNPATAGGAQAGDAQAAEEEEPRETLLGQGFKAFASSIPQLARLLWKLTTDPRVPVKHKAILGGAAAYLLSPFDIIPDRLPGVGQLDDFAVVVAALDIVLNQTDDAIVHSHWTGDPRTLDNIRRVVGIASQIRGGKVRRWMMREKA
jgi:uncharacterized membrane protein YkvA (DUF1232 family)